MDNFHICIKENKNIEPETKRPLAPNKEAGQKKDDAAPQSEEEILGNARFEKLREALMHCNKQHGEEICFIGYKKLNIPDFVGCIGTSDGISVEILPKVELGETEEDTRQIFNEMLLVYVEKKSKKKLQIDDVHASVYKNMPFPDILILLYLKELVLLVQRGLAHTYVEQEDNLPLFKGKLDLMKHLRYNFIHKERSYVRYDEFTADRPVNRLLKAALLTALQTTEYADNRRKAMQLLPHFDLVKDVQNNWQPEEQRINLQRNIKDYYENPLDLALCILKNMRPSSWHGNKKMYSFLFKMYDVFEAYVAKALSPFAKEHSYTLKSQDKPYYLMKMKRTKNPKEIFNLQPDMVMRPKIIRNNEGNKSPTLILDTKWKEINQFDEKNKYGIKEKDIYQLYAYGKRYEQKEKVPVCLVLLYPKNDKFTKQIQMIEPNGSTNSTLRLHIVPMDLSELSKRGGDPLGETREILEEIIGKRSKAAAA